MSKTFDISTLEKEHQSLFPKCESLCKEIIRQIQYLTEKNGLQLAVPVQYRAKKFSSISDKLKQGRFNVKKSLLELQDLAGVRVITLFKRDAAKMTELITSHFDVLKQYNTEEKLEDSEFGYSSIHIIGKIKQSWLDLPSFSDFGDLKFEVQVRTLSQHSWAEASNVFQYKKEDNVPKPLKRSISRISALLETVDLEFERLLNERENYKIEVKGHLSNESINLSLNVDLLEEILSQRLPIGHKDSEDDISELLENLNVFGYNTINSLLTLIDNHLEEALRENKRICDGFIELYKIDADTSGFDHYYIDHASIERILKGFYFTYTGLVRTMLTQEHKRNWYEIYKEKLQPK